MRLFWFGFPVLIVFKRKALHEACGFVDVHLRVVSKAMKKKEKTRRKRRKSHHNHDS